MYKPTDKAKNVKEGSVITVNYEGKNIYGQLVNPQFSHNETIDKEKNS